MARSRRRRIRPAPIPPDLQAALTDPNMYSRLGAASELRSRLTSDDLPVAAGAYEALAEVARTDIRTVADPAAAALSQAALHPEETELDFGELRQGSAPPHRMVRLLGPPLARACAPRASDDWIHVNEAAEGFDISVDTANAGTQRGTVDLKGPTGEAVITIEVNLVPSPPQSSPGPHQGGPADLGVMVPTGATGQSERQAEEKARQDAQQAADRQAAEQAERDAQQAAQPSPASPAPVGPAAVQSGTAERAVTPPRAGDRREKTPGGGTRRGRKGWLWAGGGVLAAGVAAAIAVSVATSTSQLTLNQLRPGDCLAGSNLRLGAGGDWPDEVTAVPCTQRHLAEVFFADNNFWPQSLSYPGRSKVDYQARARCWSAFRTYDGILQSKSAFNYIRVRPARAIDWAQGSRSLHCIAYKRTSQYPGGAPVDYSIKDSNR